MSNREPPRRGRAEGKAELAATSFIFVVYVLTQLATYIMALARWFREPHGGFTNGLIDLAWAIVPVVNYTYVWDMWGDSLEFVVRGFTR